MQDPKLVMAPCYRMIHLIKPSLPTNIKRSKVWNSRYQVFESIWDYLGNQSAAEMLILEHIWDYLGSQSAAEKLILEMYDLEGHLPDVWASLRIQVTGELILNIEGRCQECSSFL
ncbi:hypothetical protein AVEN_65434-1 [Araneus ventricosus]|uniref:Uncharacterized protein n=1 Tax=Araneus ventricosus TaxID=182803 RepID=A0A4Y2BHN0_ARAVE|nr:hypothetical protein AVEN_65434-1 [Araneus ventricosus]